MQAAPLHSMLSILFERNQTLLNLLQRRNATDPRLLDRERGRAVGEVHSRVRGTVLMEMDKKSGSEDIAGPGRINFVGGIGWKMRSRAALEQGSPTRSIGRDKQRDIHTPPGEQFIDCIAPILREGQQVVAAENQHIEQRKNLFCGLPGCGPDTAIEIPAAQPALGCRRQQRARSAGQVTNEERRNLLGQWSEQDNRGAQPGRGNIYERQFRSARAQELYAKTVCIAILERRTHRNPADGQSNARQCFRKGQSFIRARHNRRGQSQVIGGQGGKSYRATEREITSRQEITCNMPDGQKRRRKIAVYRPTRFSEMTTRRASPSPMLSVLISLLSASAICTMRRSCGGMASSAIERR